MKLDRIEKTPCRNMSPSNHIQKVAIVGAGGNIVSYMTEALLNTGKHIVTAITRNESTSKFSEGVRPVYVDYENQASIVDALRGQEALIITINYFASRDLQERLVRAAAEADVPWILPNEWAPDSNHDGLTRDLPNLSAAPRIRDLIKSLGRSSYMSVACGLWYEWCLSTPALFGIDTVAKEAVLYDEGETKICTSTWPQIGKAVAALLSLPMNPESHQTQERSLQHFRNRIVYVSSFTVSQKDMLESVLRVTGDPETEWKISKYAVQQIYKDAAVARKEGDRQRGRWIYSRVFFDDGAGDHGKREGLANDILALPEESIDEATKTAIQWARVAAAEV